MQTAKILATTLVCLAFSSAAKAEICDYRLSSLMGGDAASAVGVAGTGALVAGPAMQAAGLYTLTHSVTGLTMVGSTAAGASAAGTVGIIGGTGGAAGTVAAVAMAPATVVAGAITAVGVGGSEGVCYFYDDRITEFDAVLSELREYEAQVGPEQFRLVLSTDNGPEVYILVGQGDAQARYEAVDLYIVNGVLIHRDWFQNTVVGTLFEG